MPNITKSNSAIILADAPNSIDEFLNIYKNNQTYLIALDGAANKLAEKNVIPNVILGDFDSISKSTQSFFVANNVQFVEAYDQSKTDLEKAIEFCDNSNIKKIEIYNALGGRNDHSIGNISFLKKYFNKKRPIKICSYVDYLELFSNENIEIIGPIDANIGFFGFPNAVISTKGLRYDVEKYALELGNSESVANSLSETKAVASISGFCLISYSLKSKIKRL